MQRTADNATNPKREEGWSWGRVWLEVCELADNFGSGGSLGGGLWAIFAGLAD